MSNISVKNNSNKKLNEINNKSPYNIKTEKEQVLKLINNTNNMLVSDDTFSTHISFNNNNNTSSENSSYMNSTKNKFDESYNENNNINKFNQLNNSKLSSLKSSNVTMKSNSIKKNHNNFNINNSNKTGNSFNFNNVETASNNDGIIKFNITNKGTVVSLPTKLNPLKLKKDIVIEDKDNIKSIINSKDNSLSINNISLSDLKINKKKSIEKNLPKLN